MIKNFKKKRLIIIEVSPTDTLTKLSLVLKEKGYETILISFTEGSGDSFTNEGYTKIINFNAKFLKTSFKSIPSLIKLGLNKFSEIIKNILLIRKLKPSLVIVRTTPNWLYFLVKQYFKEIPVIYFPFDIRSFVYNDLNQAISQGIPRFELQAERYAFLNADGIIHKGTKEELNQLNKKILGKINIKCPEMLLLPYALKELITPFNDKPFRKNEIHLVYVGHVPIDLPWLENIKKLTEQNIFIHLYSKTNALTFIEDEKRIMKGCTSILNNKFIRFHKSVNQKELSKEISKYDYGVYGFNEVDSPHYNFTTGNKIASYIEAGIPILAASEYKAVADIIKKYNLGVTFKLKDLKNLRKIIAKRKKSDFKNGILKARKSFEFRTHLQRIEEFFDKTKEYIVHKNAL